MDTTIGTRPEEVGLCSRQLARVNDWAQRLVDDGRLPGVTPMVARPGRVAHLHCCGKAASAAGAAGLPELGIQAAPVELIVPSYLDRYRPGGGKLERVPI